MRIQNCPFCHLEKAQIIFENDYAVVIYDIKPLTKGHALIIPKRHITDCSELRPMEYVALGQLALEYRNFMLDQDPTVNGFNYRVNEGKVAGQTVFHYHMHIVPRRDNDGLTIIGGRPDSSPEEHH